MREVLVELVEGKQREKEEEEGGRKEWFLKREEEGRVGSYRCQALHLPGAGFGGRGVRVGRLLCVLGV